MQPPDSIKSSNPIKWLRFFGPGAIVASVTIGSGETIFPSRGGAVFGLSLLWIILLVAALKWNLTYSGMRHMILSGAHPLERWNCIPGPRGWLHLFILIIAMVFFPLSYGFLAGVLGTICITIFGGNPGNALPWAILMTAVAMFLLLSRGYRFLEKGQVIILGTLILAVLFAVFHCSPDWPAVARGMFIPGPLSYPEWLADKFPRLADRPVWVELLVYISFIGGGGSTYLGYISLLRDKRWGRGHMGPATRAELDAMAGDREHPARLWLRAARVDTLVSFGMVVLVSAAFCILGAELLAPAHLVPDKNQLLSRQAVFLSSISAHLVPLYWAGVFMAFFGSLYGAPELSSRFVFEILDASPRLHGRLNAKKIRLVVISWCLGGALLVLGWKNWIDKDLQLMDLITPSAICLGTVLSGILALANPFMDWKFLPRGLHMSRLMAGLNITVGLAFIIAAVIAFRKMGIHNAIVIACIFGISLVPAAMGAWGKPGMADTPGHKKY